MASITVGPDTFVTLSYVLFDERGEAVDRVTESEPLTYVHGYAQIVPGLERGIEGMKAGERRSITVDPDEAFGQRDEAGIFAVDKEDFPDSEQVTPGDEFMAQSPDGEPMAMRVIEVRSDAFVVDTNHPLAGQRVRFEVEVSDVRPASEQEIQEAESELEDQIGADHACCGHDHDHGHAHDHAEPVDRLVQLTTKKDG
jgi:FKBP-type peptidyl-prolyl cis-trans isomerase SlyD